MSFAALVVVAMIGGQGASPVGTYRADFSQAPRSSRDPLNAYFGRSYLALASDGQFELCGIEQRGIWRQEGDRLILVYDGFFHIRYDKSREELKGVQPRSNLEGMVLRKGKGGTLILNEWGRVRGPIVFRPMPKRSIAELLVKSESDEMTAEAYEAYAAVSERKQAEWPEFLRFINDPKRGWMQRNWAALILSGLKDPAGIEAAARLIGNLKPTAEARRERSIARSLAGVVVRHPTTAAVELLLAAQGKGLIDASQVAPALGALKREAYVPILIGWLSSERAWDRSESLEALTLMNAAAALPEARRLTADPEERVQLFAHGLIARCSSDSAERSAAVAKIATWIKSSDFLLPFAAVDALCRSGHPAALPHLAAILISDMPAINRRNTATALGDLGDVRAVPALLEARQRRTDFEGLRDESEVRVAIAEALVKLGKAKRGSAGSS